MQKEKFNFDFPLLEPWEEISAHEEMISAELKKEVRKDDPLFGKEASAIARRKDCDDILFEIEGMPERFAVVHLTWSGKKDLHSGFPETTLYSSLDKWKKECMLPDHEDYTS